MVTVEEGFISGNRTCGTSVGAVQVNELHSLGRRELKQPITVDRHLIKLLSSLALNEYDTYAIRTLQRSRFITERDVTHC
jgi:hypothetical protein